MAPFRSREDAPMARPSKLTEEVVEAIVSAVAGGLPRRLAAHAAGVSAATLYAWQRAGRRKAGAEYVEFLDRLKRAEAEAVGYHIRQINRAARAGKWQASAWWLERMHPDEYGSERKRVRELARLLNDLSAQLDQLGPSRRPRGQPTPAALPGGEGSGSG